MVEKVVVGWSGGKDSALALFEVSQLGMQVVGLITNVTQDYDRISIHGVRRVLLEQQAESLGLPLKKMMLVQGVSDKEYEKEFTAVLRSYRTQGITSMVFGDIFLEDVKKFRDESLTKLGMQGIYPLWKQNTKRIAEKFIKLGFKAMVTVVDGNVLGKEFAGREYNVQFLAELPAGVDPCGENGEFHSFVYDGPNFSKPVKFRKGEVTLKQNRFWHCDLIPM
ncbi:MAG: diphthine--ammonia ligase [Candidatus Bathyarchaeota archaeon]|nr:diphthine--ammonia ligase [Candidatus Bathyarchaeota archaeon]